MQATRVRSSILSTVAYDADKELLDLRFHNGRVYRYFGVPAAVHRGLLRATSKGTYFNDVIRDDYEFVRLNDSRKRQR